MPQIVPPGQAPGAEHYPSPGRRRRAGRRFKMLLAALALFFVVIAATAAWYVWQAQLPSAEWAPAPDPEQIRLVVGTEERTDLLPLVEEGEIYLPLDLVAELFDPHIAYDEETDTVEIMVPRGLFQAKTAELTAYLNRQAVELQVAPAADGDGGVYLSADLAARLYPAAFRLVPGTSWVIIDYRGQPMVMVGPSAGGDDTVTFIRTEASVKAPIVDELAPGGAVPVYGEADGWYYVRAEDGRTGFVRKSETEIAFVSPGFAADGTPEPGVIVGQAGSGSGGDEGAGGDNPGNDPLEPDGDEGAGDDKPANDPLKPGGEAPAYGWPGDPAGVPVRADGHPFGMPVNLTWDVVGVPLPAPARVGEIPGLTVVSPTWFELADDQGNVRSLATHSYVERAHEMGYQVWPLVASDFRDPDVTSRVLRDPARRRRAIDQILAHAVLYGVDGINLDFENMHLADKDYYVRFVREFSALAREQGLVVSVDVTFHSSSPNWSLVYDRRALANAVDYVIVMGYDQHTGANGPGSVSQRIWVERRLPDILAEVPPEKLILAVPFYTRLYKREVSGKLSSWAVGMEFAREWVEERNLTPQWDEASGQFYVSWVNPEDESVYDLWLETPESMAWRAELASRYGLAGLASWRAGFEEEAVWAAINDHLRR